MSCFLNTVTLCYAQDVTWEHASPEQARLHLVTSEVPEVTPRRAKPDMLHVPVTPSQLHVPSSLSIYAICTHSDSHQVKICLFKMIQVQSSSRFQRQSVSLSNNNTNRSSWSCSVCQNLLSQSYK